MDSIPIYLMIFSVLNTIASNALFKNYLRSNSLAENPLNTKRWLTINDVADYHVLKTKLNQHQKKIITVFKNWELINLSGFPLSIIIWVVISLSFR